MTSAAFKLEGRVEAVLVAANFDSSVSVPVQKIQLIREHGVGGDNHAGTRLADVRERELLSFGLPKGIEVANHRAFSAISAEELAEITEAMGLQESIPYGCLGENLVLSGIPEFSRLPTGTMLFFQKREKKPRTAVLMVWGENAPCKKPGEMIQEEFPDVEGLVRLFRRAAIGKRGVVGSIYVSGNVHAGDTVIVKVPNQRIYAPE